MKNQDICIVEYDPEKEEIVGYPKPLYGRWNRQGCIEAPHLTKREYYYIAKGGRVQGVIITVTMGRAKMYGDRMKRSENLIGNHVPGESMRKTRIIFKSQNISIRIPVLQNQAQVM